jgi:hypothetical protein
MEMTVIPLKQLISLLNRKNYCILADIVDASAYKVMVRNQAFITADEFEAYCNDDICNDLKNDVYTIVVNIKK